MASKVQPLGACPPSLKKSTGKLVDLRSPVQKSPLNMIEVASTACESTSDSLSSLHLIQTNKLTSPAMIPRGRISTGGISDLNSSTATLTASPVGKANVGLDWMAPSTTTPAVEDAGHDAFYPKLEMSTIVSDHEDDVSENIPALKPVSLCQLPKQRGEAQPVHHVQVVKKIRERACDEENHFGLCEHYASQLDRALEVGFGNINWHCGFNLHHLAAKRNSMELLQFLLSQDVVPVHAIDEFGKKPIDYACSKKRDTVYYMLESVMRHVPAPDTEAEAEYQDAKNGICKIKKEKSKDTGLKNVAETASMENVAEGAVALKRPADLMSAYEAEQACPPEYAKIAKQLSNGAAWETIQWPRGTSLLHWAARNGKDELCRYLVFEYRVDTRAEDVCGRSSIYYAKLKKHRKLAKKLIASFGFF